MKKLLLPFCLFIESTVWAQPNSNRYDSLTEAYEKAGYHGVILVARGNQVLYEKGYGYANFEQKIPHTPATLFKIESVGKIFTATAIMQLVEAKKIKLSQTLKELLPALKIATADKITVDHLLKHTAGLQSPWDNASWDFKKNYSRAALEKIITETSLANDTPGKDWYYSNSGYIILGWIIEKVTGQPYDEYMSKNYFTPLGMTNTRHLNDTIMPLNGGAQPYRIIHNKKYIPLTTTVGPKASAAGGWISTTKDLYQFMYALSAEKLIKLETLNTMRTANGTAPKDSAFRYYAYGLETYHNEVIKGVDIYGHNGGGAGFSIDAYVEAASGYIVISCTNLYQNSRPIAMNYLKISLGRSLQNVSALATFQLYSLIDSIGIDQFVQNQKEYFRKLSPQLYPSLFAQVADAMQLIGDNKVCSKWMELAIQYFPNEPFLRILSGDNEITLGNKVLAKYMYEQAKAVGIKKGDAMAVKAAEEKLINLKKD